MMSFLVPRLFASTWRWFLKAVAGPKDPFLQAPLIFWMHYYQRMDMARGRAGFVKKRCAACARERLMTAWGDGYACMACLFLDPRPIDQRLPLPFPLMAEPANDAASPARASESQVA